MDAPSRFDPTSMSRSRPILEAADGKSAAVPAVEVSAGSEKEIRVARARRIGLLLCGGRSTRMGRDKALLVLGGEKLVERSIHVLDEVADEVWLACGSTPRHLDLGRRLVLDEIEGAGPLAGLAAALREVENGWLCVLACDMPRVGPELFERLLAHAAHAGLDACLASTDLGLEPLCAVYHARCAPFVAASLARGDRRVVAFWENEPALHVGALELPGDLRRALKSDPSVNLNTPAEYERERGRTG
jgi:molybdopterin-guanine dinucleotide biosynthesis protein A